MSVLLRKKNVRDACYFIGILFCMVSLILWQAEVKRAVIDGLSLCATVIIPSLFPYFVVSSLFIELGLLQKAGKFLGPIIYPIFHVSGVCATALLLGFVGGYPVGAKTAISLYESGQCSKAETQRLLAFCNNSGPAFILGVVGAGVFQSVYLGLLLYGIHIAASICTGILFRFYQFDKKDRQRKNTVIKIKATSFSKSFTSSVLSALQSVLNITAFVLVFSVFTRILILSGLFGVISKFLALILSPIGMDGMWAGRLLSGILEITTGVSSLIGVKFSVAKLSMASFMLGWAGLSVHVQVLSFLGDSGLSARPYFLGKLVHGVLAALFTALFFLFYPLGEPVWLLFFQQAEEIACLSFLETAKISAAGACITGIMLALMAIFILKRGRLKQGKGRGKSCRD